MNIYVGNIPYAATETDLEKLFGEHGPVATVRIIRDRYDGRSKGFGFVEMENRSDGERAIAALNGYKMMGRSLRVNEDRGSREPQSQERSEKQSHRPVETLSTDKEHESFHNPYTFVASPPRDRIKQGEFAGDFDPLACDSDLGHAALGSNLWTGHIPIKLTTVTPLVLLKDDGRERNPREHQIYDVFDRIPESSLRGMLRSAYEVVTNSRYGCFSNDDRLAYRMRPQEALNLVPLVIEHGGNGELVARLYTGTSTPTNRGPGNGAGGRGPMYAAMLTRYHSNANLNSKCLVYDAQTGRRETYEPQTGHEVSAEIVSSRHDRPFYSFWKAVQVWPKGSPSPQTQGRVVTGRVLITNQNMGNKHDERIFFNPETRTFPITETLEKAWQMRIKSYRDAHSEDDIFGRKNDQDRRVDPWEKIGDDPGKTAWSPHLYHDGKNKNRWGETPHDAAKLRPNDMVYARCEFSGNTITGIADLYPVMISRELYADSPKDLLDRSLWPAKKRNELSPADRLFGWVPQLDQEEQHQERQPYKGRIRVVCEDQSRSEIIQRFDGESLPLTILGQPKPAQGRFYVAKDVAGTPQHGVSKTGAGYDASQGKRLRGRKQYWHHKALEAELTENKQTECYWQPSTEDRTQVKHKGRYQEYRRPNKDGEPQRDPQNRSIKGWIKPGSEFRVSLYVQNLQSEEVGALLWLLSLPEKYYFKLGYGKPLGFGSVKMEVDWDRPDCANGCLPLANGEDWKTYYATFDADAVSLAKLDPPQQQKCIQDFQSAMKDAYRKVDFESLPFIRGFLQVLAGPAEDFPIHYPRLEHKPNPEGKNFEWFTANENGRDRNEDGEKCALPEVTKATGLPYKPVVRKKST